MSNFFRQEVDAAVDALLLQQIILYPTDTVWGLGCDAELPRVIDRLYALKKRPSGKPCLILVADEQMFARYAAVVPANLPELLAAETRPTTYVVPASSQVAPSLQAPDGTIGLRISQDEFTHKIVRRLGHGLVATSANFSGEPAAAMYKEVSPELVRAVDYVANWRQDDTKSAAPSRVVRVEADGTLTVLRD
ncbi:Sua5/YciO/YrdC/YwlC family protein [Hymenobacter sp. BT18]|uniref:L-threonylcarbamoyladenylate synthase n=1 Tax=Hymenobacter sp. BT18 TaxID=2835648 RepID=UPI00143ED70A|nr:L-threonylcarbamoyladenylate synthase [Hymenobacter sp. BT18]QIX60334.1 Sua5/YciO/YrdC/YwlC family protein [Hymenobacter sp. BT18]